jgi:ribosome-associated toxin RatA of RatAB toxin-antitoxin module
MSLKIQYSTVIGSPVEDVWAFMEDLDNYPLFMPGLVEMRQTTPGPRQHGTQIVWTYQFLGQQFDITLNVTDYQAPNRFAATLRAGPMQLQGVWTYAAVDPVTTRMTTLIEGETAGLFKVADPLAARAMERQVAASYGTLKDLVESRAAVRV